MTLAHQSFAANTQGRDFLLGDLHGEYDALIAAMDRAQFNPGRDRIFSVGDIVDRGPKVPDCLNLLDEPYFHMVRGNHEELTIRAADGEENRELWLWNGGEWGDRLPKAELAEIREKLSELPLAITVGAGDGARIGVCHAECPVKDWAKVEAGDLTAKEVERMLWGRAVLSRRGPKKVRNITLTVHGHTPLPEPMKRKNALFIDTGCVYGGPLTLIDFSEALAI